MVFDRGKTSVLPLYISREKYTVKDLAAVRRLSCVLSGRLWTAAKRIEQTVMTSRKKGSYVSNN